MKKINCKNELHAQKQSIKLRQKMLEGEIYSYWDELKGALNPLNYAKEAFNTVIQQQTVGNLNDQSVLKKSFT